MKIGLQTHLSAAREGLSLKGPLANDPTARVLHALLLALMCWRVLYFPIVLPLSRKKPESAAIFGSILLVLLISLWLLRRGSFLASSLVFLCGNWAFYTFLMALSMGIRSRVLVFYLVLPISAAWLLGLRAALISAGICIASSLMFAVLQQFGVTWWNYFPSYSLIAYWSEVLVVMITTTVPVSRILKTLHEALARSETAERSLLKYQTGLEELVHHRTAELEDARDQAQGASRAKSAFLSTVSHELRSPLNTILLLSDPACVDPGTSEQSRIDLQLIQGSGRSLLHLINDVLDSARIEAGQVVVENGPVDVSELLREVGDFLRVRAEKKSLDLWTEEALGSHRFVRADGAKLRHILVNLIDNAIKYTDRGKVTVCTKIEPMDSTDRLLLRFEVSDTGIGIAAQDQSRIFEPFTRAGNTAAHQGTGLGLSITRQYVNMMGGNILVESAPGEGSHFIVQVQVDAVADSEVPPANATPLGALRLACGQTEFRVLVIEDRLEDRLILRRLLEEAGFHVEAAETGESGVEIFRVWRPHFIWMDRRLPLMDGLETTRRIRSLDSDRNVKIVGISASAFASEREEMLASGLDDFVQKPFLPRDIFDCMARHLRVRYEYVGGGA